MNIFVTDDCPVQSARNLPDKHIVKMPLETCQMLAIIYSDWYYGVGKLYKSDGTPYRTQHGAFRNHPCTQWAAANQYNLAWLIKHGLALSNEYTARYDKVHTCHDVLCQAQTIWYNCFDYEIYGDINIAASKVTSFTRAMPESIKFDTTIDTITAYKQYLNTKPWLASNYLRIPSRKPSFIITTMTTSNVNDLPVYDFSNDKPATEQYPEPKIAEKDILKDAIAKAEAAMAAKSAKRPLVKAKKSGKAGRIVGISKDENEFLYDLLSKHIFECSDFNAMIEENQATYDKLLARYNNK